MFVYWESLVDTLLGRNDEVILYVVLDPILFVTVVVQNQSLDLKLYPY